MVFMDLHAYCMKMIRCHLTSSYSFDATVKRCLDYTNQPHIETLMIIILNISVSDIMKGRLCYFCYITAQISHYKRSLGTLLKKRIRARETMQCCVIQRTLKRLKINLLSSSQYCSSTQIFYGKVEDSRSTRWNIFTLQMWKMN